MTHIKHDKLQCLALIAIIIINLGTLLIVAPLSQNLSDLGNALGYRIYLILWAGSAAAYFYCYTMKLVRLTHYTYTPGIWILRFCCLCMLVSVLFPYIPQQSPVLAQWHTRIAMSGTIGFVIFFFHYVSSLLMTYPTQFPKILSSYLMLVVFNCLLFLLNGGVSTLLEISFTIIMSTLLLWYRITLSKSTTT